MSRLFVGLLLLFTNQLFSQSFVSMGIGVSNYTNLKFHWIDKLINEDINTKSGIKPEDCYKVAYLFQKSISKNLKLNLGATLQKQGVNIKSVSSKISFDTYMQHINHSGFIKECYFILPFSVEHKAIGVYAGFALRMMIFQHFALTRSNQIISQKTNETLLSYSEYTNSFSAFKPYENQLMDQSLVSDYNGKTNTGFLQNGIFFGYNYILSQRWLFTIQYDYTQLSRGFDDSFSWQLTGSVGIKLQSSNKKTEESEL